MIIGDVLATASLLVAIALTSWALIIGCALIFPIRSGIAELQVATRPWKSIGVGTLLLAVLGFVALNISAIQLPIAKVVATMILMVLLAFAAIGASGIALLASKRLLAMDTGPSEFQALKTSAWIVVLSGFVPVLGWFLIGPVALLVSIGAGWSAIASRQNQRFFDTPPAS